MTPAQQAALEALTGGALPDGVAPLADARELDKLAALLSKGLTRRGEVPRAQFAAWVGVTGMRATIEDHANNVASPLRSSALSLRDVLAGGAKDIDFSWPQNVQMLTAWVASGALTQAQADDLLDMSLHAVTIGRLAVEAALNETED